MADDLLHNIIQTLRERDLPYDRDALRTALADPETQTEIREWVEEYLSPETLLTKDEVARHDFWVKSGEFDTLAGQDLSRIQGLTDHELHTAIEELKRSTAAIEKQTENLRLQQNAMSTLVTNERRTKQSRAQLEREQARKWNAEKNQITAAVMELLQSLKYKTADMEQQLKASEFGAKQTVDGILKSDDKLLLSLQKLASDLDSGEPESEDAIANIRELCARLIKHTVEGIRTRLDRIYLESLGNPTGTAEEENATEATELQEELESLYSEILPVAQMSTEQQYLEPALKMIASNSGQGQERTVKAIEYIQDCLKFLTNRVETFLDRAEEAQCHKMAMETMLGIAKEELSRSATIHRAASPTKLPPKRRMSSASKKSPQRGHRRRSSSGQGEQELEPEQQLTRHLGLALPVAGDSTEATAKLLEKAILERKSRVEIHASNLQATTEASISTYLSDAYGTLNLLRGALLADTRYHNVQLMDPELEDLVDHLERDVLDVEGELEKVNLHCLQSRNVHRDQFVDRWSR